MKNSKILTVAGIIAMGVSPFLSAIGMRSTLKCEKITYYIKKYSCYVNLGNILFLKY